MIAHGHGRNTHGADIWLEPLSDAGEWSRLMLDVMGRFPATAALSIAVWQPIAAADLLRDLPPAV